MLIFSFHREAVGVVGRPDPQTDGLAPAGDDWYANVIRVDGRKCLLVTHADTLFSVFVPDVGRRAPPSRAAGGAGHRRRLTAEGLHPNTLGVLNPATVTIAKTADRRVLG